MSAKKIIAVLGATGAQGGGLARSILAAGDFSVRAISRKTGSDAAKALAAQGAEVVAADLDDVESLTRAFTGAHGVYGVTNFWEHFSVEKEMAQAANIAEAAKRAGVAHVVWSTLEDTREFIPLEDDRMPTLQGKYKVPHFDGKGASNQEFTKRGVPTTFLLTSFYWENMLYFGMGPKKSADGTYAINLPMADKPLSGIAVADIGKCAHGVFKAGDAYIGKTVGIAGEHITGADMAASLTKALGVTVTYNAVPFDVYRGFGFPGADDLGNMFQFYVEFNDSFSGRRDVAFSRSLNPDLMSFDAWVAARKAEIPLD